MEEIFEKIYDSIYEMEKRKLYSEKEKLELIKKNIKNVHCIYLNSQSLERVSNTLLKEIDFDILDLFDKYIVLESKNENFCERLSYNFEILKEKWKKSIMEEK